ncbi:putative potassium transport system protein Kup 2 [Gammaproteobacteria bacterium]
MEKIVEFFFMKNHSHNRRTVPLALAALGIVYGDIGTSPLYAFKEVFNGPHGLPLGEIQVFAALSALFWAVMLIVSVKYVWFMLHLDNQGEGGVLALTALVHRLVRSTSRWSKAVISVGIFAAALFYGDAMITPAISVLSAVEGLIIVAPQLNQWVVTITVGILIGLFLIQRQGTERVGRLFGPVTLLWFLVLACLGTISIVETPAVLAALDPRHAVRFAVHQPGAFFLLLSGVFLALTGGEALYADMGHFGPRPIRLVWFLLVCPALLLNYFGQGALVLRNPAAVSNPFYLLAPDWLTLPLVILATAATVIASQATISGAYSMTLQASRLGYLPRLRVLHTSDTERGQIYIPSINWLMLVAVLWIVLEFGTSASLAAAYGIAVSGTMIITTLLTLFIIPVLPSRRARLAFLSAFLTLGGLEWLFFGSNLAKIADGGWVPLAIGVGIYIMLTTWKNGSDLMSAQRRQQDISLANFLSWPRLEATVVPGRAVYLTSDPELVPSALFHNLKHYKVMHDEIIFLHVVTENVPRITPDKRILTRNLAPGLSAMAVRFGFREEPNISAVLFDEAYALEMEPMTTSFFVARATIIDGPGGLSRWRTSLFAWMFRQSEGAASYYSLPPNRVVEIGAQILL